MAYQVCRNGSVLSEDYGGADKDTRFQAASVSKIVLAALMVMLADEGRLDLDDPVSRWWAPAPPAWTDMRLAHLLSHLSGLGHWNDVPGFDLNDPPGPDDLIARVSARPLLSVPGTQWRYSGPGFVLASKVIELASQQSYAMIADEHIFRPLGMGRSTSGFVPAPADRASPEVDGQGIPLAADFTALVGTGDLWTTIADLTRLAGLSTDPRFEGVWAKMTQPRAPLADPGPGQVVARAYGCGLYMGTICGRSAFFHHGDVPGFRSMLLWLPREEITVVILSNEDSTDTDALTGQLVADAIA